MLKSPTRSQFARSLLGTAAVASLLNGCAAIDRIKQLGEPVALSPIDNPTAKPGYKPAQMPMPTPQPASYNPNSLWRNGSRAFFNDQRAHIVGDILTVKVNINDTALAAVVTQLLPNGNMVIEGKQEVRLNTEIRELIVAGVVRPEDIQSDNTIELPKIAEARLAYGGRGTLTNIQTERWGQQVVDIALPF
jgi:flagellar basal body L-ring protein FlgH